MYVSIGIHFTLYKFLLSTLLAEVFLGSLEQKITLTSSNIYYIKLYEHQKQTSPKVNYNYLLITNSDFFVFYLQIRILIYFKIFQLLIIK